MKTLWLSMKHVARKLRNRILARYAQPATTVTSEALVATADAVTSAGNRELLERFQVATSGLVTDFVADGDEYYLYALLEFLKLLDQSMNTQPCLSDGHGDIRVSSVEQFAVSVAERVAWGKYVTPHDIREFFEETCQNFDDDILLAVNVARKHQAKFQIALKQKAA